MTTYFKHSLDGLVADDVGRCHPLELILVNVAVVVLIKYPGRDDKTKQIDGMFCYELEGRDSQVLPVSLALGVSFLQEAEHPRGVLDVTDEVILTNLTTRATVINSVL